MYQCPVCKKTIEPDRLGKWFQCSQCNYLLCLKANDKTNTTWLQAGILLGKDILEIDVKDGVTPAPVNLTGANSRAFAQAVPSAQLSAEEIKLARERIKSDLATQDTEMKKLAAQMSTGASNTATIERLTNEISKIKQTKDTLLKQDADFDRQQKRLLEKQQEEAKAKRSTQTPSYSPPDKNKYAFGCSMIIVATALIFFGFKLHIEWNVNALLWLVGITLVGGIINAASNGMDL